MTEMKQSARRTEGWVSRGCPRRSVGRRSAGRGCRSGHARLRAPRAVNAVARCRFSVRIVKAAGGVAPERELPAFAAERFSSWVPAAPSMCRCRRHVAG